MLKIGNKLIGALFILLVAISCGPSDENGNEEAERGRLIAVETVTIERDTYEDFVRLTGTVEAIEDAVISAETSGRILSIKDRGERVQEGEVIAQLDNRLIQAQYTAAQTAFELAEDTYNRMETLYADSIVSTQDFRNARAQRDQARSQLDQAEKQFRDASIQAPFDGRVEERMISEGELVNPGMPVVRLVNADRVRVLSGIPERYAGEITEGTPVYVEVRSAGIQEHSGTISYAGNVIDPDTRTYTIEVELNNPGQLIKPEMVVNLRVQRQTLEGAIVIPRTAVVRDETGTNVFVANPNGSSKTAELISVRTGPASGSLVQILDGLEAGDEVVVSGMRSLSNGDRLNILNNQSSTERAEVLQENNRPVVNY